MLHLNHGAVLIVGLLGIITKPCSAATSLKPQLCRIPPSPKRSGFSWSWWLRSSRAKELPRVQVREAESFEV